MVKREAKFEIAVCIGVRGWCFNVPDVLLCKSGGPWRMTMKELTNMIIAI